MDGEDQVQDHQHDTPDAEVDAPVDAPSAAEPTAATALDLDAIQQDLADVEVALARLDAGTYWTDEVSGDPLPAELLAERPTARRA